MLVDPVRAQGAGKHADLVGCTGATMEDGTVYRADRGRMDVERDDHAKAMIKNSDGFIVEEKFSGAGIAGATCTGCGFGAFKWQCNAPCPRCGGEIKEDQ
jgi:hypothetical protein